MRSGRTEIKTYQKQRKEASRCLVAPIVMLFVGVEVEMREAEIVEHTADKADVVRRAQTVSTTSLEIARTSETGLQTTHKDSVLAWQHLVLHRCKATSEYLRLVRTVVLAGLRWLCASRVDDPDDMFLFGKHLHLQLAQTVTSHRAVTHGTERIAAGHVFRTDGNHISFCLILVHTKGQLLTQPPRN